MPRSEIADERSNEDDRQDSEEETCEPNVLDAHKPIVRAATLPFAGADCQALTDRVMAKLGFA